MVQLLAKRFQKAIALFLATLFYCDLVIGGMYSPWRRQINNTYDFTRDGCFFMPFNADRESDALYFEGGGNYAPGLYADGYLNNKGREENGDAGGYDDKEFTNGPSQPEMQAFQSVNSNNMVDLFTGDFSYNIPLMDVGGYPLNLSYRSGVTMDQEASWVGLGWNINPGTITRNMRGLPDDFNGANDTITKTASIKENKTIGVTAGANLEIIGFPASEKDTSGPFGLGVGATIGVFHNTYKGWGLETGLNASIRAGIGGKGSLTTGLSITNNSQEGMTVSPSFSVNLAKSEVTDKWGLSGNLTTSLTYSTRAGLKSLDLSAGIRQYAIDKKNQTKENEVTSASGYGSSVSFATASYMPSISLPYTSKQFSFTGKAALEIWGLDPNFFISGYVSTQGIKPEDTTLALPAYGYLNYQHGAQNPSALLDFNREKEIPYRENPPVPNIAIPSYTYDAFSITGEGTGGMFRAYRGDIGFIYDHYIKTKDESDRFSADIGTGPAGNIIHAGIDVNLNNSYTQNSAWLSGNALKDVIAFRNPDTTFEPVYFRNPGEKSINTKDFYNAVGGDDVVTVNLSQAGSNSPFIGATNYLRRYRNKSYISNILLSKTSAVKKERDKRSQVISYLTAEEDTIAGLNKYIENYAVNHWGLRNCNKVIPGYPAADTLKINDTLSVEKRVNSFRKANHVSEIDVLNADGRRYVYGIPVYNFLQKEVTFSADHVYGDPAEGLVTYSPGTDNSTQNNITATDNYYNCEKMPPYAHSFLLSAILSPDYVDLTGDGVSDDDFGDAVKFNYSKVAGISNPFKWRTPYTDHNEASYSEGLKTDFKDDRGSYVYGEKELWYLNSVESKTMIATFTLDDRKDLLPADETGHKDKTNNNHNGGKLLREINLYTKADYLTKGTAARPVKTVHFEYTYQLCLGVNKETGSSYAYYKDSGKLTLKKLWFSYNGNDKKRPQNLYTFYYSSQNPGYNIKSYDRWGNYKDPSQNPHSLTNAEYPYAVQDSVSAAQNAAAWALDSIILPSGGRMKITYESDDYGYIQNKRAAQMFRIAGLSTSAGGSLKATLYTPGSDDNLYVFIKSSQVIATKKDVYYKYLEGIEKLYLRLLVKMPSDTYSSGSEYVPCYADIDTAAGGGYDRVDDHTFYVKLKGVNLAGDQDGNYSPLAKAAIQFLRLNLPAKAYPGSQVGDDLTLKDAVYMVLAMYHNIQDALKSFDQIARQSGNGWASMIDTGRSFIRLDNPDLKKYGGGSRVKTIKIYDNWDAMTGQKQSVYGQTYTYTTAREINGVTTTISSGVASYEPMIGGDENPFHVPLRFTERVAPLAPITLGYVEEPLGESFFPSAGVGYSNVRVRSVNTAKRKSANGYEETKFYTTYDFPTLVDNSMLDDYTKKRYKPDLRNFLRIDAKHYLAFSQGFKIELNDMNGKLRSQATYPETDSANYISYTENFYKVDNMDAVFKHLDNTVAAIDPQGIVDTTAIIGKDVELMMDMREQLSETTGNNFSPNTDVFLIGVFPVFLPSSWYLPQHEEDKYTSVATTKIIQRYGILDSVIHVEKGSLVSTKNLLYDAETGDVLLTRTNNEFNDPIYNFTYPAHWAYSGMGQAYKNIDAVFTSEQGHTITINDGVLASPGKYPGLKKYFESGDEILVRGRIKTGEAPSVNCDGVSISCNYNVFADDTSSAKIWAVNAKKIDAASSQTIVFIDKDGNPYSATDVCMKIVRSGRRNMSATPVGSVTCLKNPVKVKSGKLTVVLDSSANIIASSAAVCNDSWKVNEALFGKDTVIGGSPVTVCRSAITQRHVNPYQYGVYGNWRSDRSYVYYGKRAETNPAAATDIRSDGTIKSFIPFWSFTNDYMEASADSSRWVWNSATTLFNKKGYELENKDPLGRYNSGQYGYNQSLPVSVTQNSKYRDQFFDGFEDYQYTNQGCSVACPAQRDMDFTKGHGSLDTVYRHSGKYSFKVSAGDSNLVTIPVIPARLDTVSQKLIADIEVHIVSDTTVTPKGSGLDTDYFSGDVRYPTVLRGNLQVKKTGYYTITATGFHGVPLPGTVCPCSPSCSLYMDLNNPGGSPYSSTTDCDDDPNLEITAFLKAGVLYSIDFGVQSGPYYLDLDTYTHSLNWYNCQIGSSAISSSYLYSDSPDSAGSVVINTEYDCSKLKGINADSTSLISSFSPAQGGKYWLSAWVKENQDCLCQNYVYNQVKLVITDSANQKTTKVITPTGNIIEGWQRYDSVIDIPANAVSIAFKMMATGSATVYFDDIRLHPFNANMKSFVYDPVNLRLMAELDENNYATFYEYDSDGTLIRVKKETQRGIQTIKETRSYLVKNPGQ